MKRALAVLVTTLSVNCTASRLPDAHAPTLVASGTYTGLSKAPDDSGFFIGGTINGHAVQFVVDYGANLSTMADTLFDALHLPRPYANATRSKRLIMRDGNQPALDSTANATVMVADTIIQYWGDFEPTIVDSLRFGSSLQPHVYIPGSLEASSYSVGALMGRDMISQFDVDMDGLRDSVRFFARAAQNSTAIMPTWLPPGIASTDCVRAITIGPRPVPSIDPNDTIKMSEQEKRESREGMVAVTRAFSQIELRFPTTIDGQAIDALFDSGTSHAIINEAGARWLHFTKTNARVHLDNDSLAPTWYVTGVVLKVGSHALTTTRVWIADAKFRSDSAYKTKPMLILGREQFRDRDLFLSHATGHVCIGAPKSSAAHAQ